MPKRGRGAANSVLGKEMGDLLSRSEGGMGAGPYKGQILWEKCGMPQTPADGGLGGLVGERVGCSWLLELMP